MAKYNIECPNCGCINQTPGILKFWQKDISCVQCKHEFNIKQSRMISKKCEKCGAIVLWDQKKPKEKCPSCGEKLINPATSKYEIVEIICPQCSCQIDVDKSKPTCPICNVEIDIKEVLAKSKLVSDTGISVIKYEGDNDTFVWKHPIEDFNLGSQLIVHESQEAIFFLNGQALDTFGPGRWSLETENLPVLKKIQDLPTGKQNPFHAEVYFINKTVQMSIPWGTAERIRFIEPETGAPIHIGAFGKMNLQVSDGRKLLVKLVGTTNSIRWGTKKERDNEVANQGEDFKHTLQEYFRPFIQTIIKSNLAATIKREKLDILEIDEQLETLSQALRTVVTDGFEEYGLVVPQFYITSISLPDGDPNFEKIKKLRTQNLITREYEFEASRVAANRKVVLEQQETGREQARYDAELKMIDAEAEAAKKRLEGFAEAEIIQAKGLATGEAMKAQGYNQKDVLQADVQTAYAEGIGQMGSNGGGSGGSGGGMMSDILGLGVGMAAMGTLGEKVGDVMKGFGGNTPTDNTSANESKTINGWKCSCGCDNNIGKFCSECGKPKPESWDCVACGTKGNKGKFCSECGQPKPELWICPHCGAKDNKGKFCSECGKSKDIPNTWDCSCGTKNITGKFCNECGKSKEDNE